MHRKLLKVSDKSTQSIEAGESDKTMQAEQNKEKQQADLMLA